LTKGWVDNDGNRQKNNAANKIKKSHPCENIASDHFFTSLTNNTLNIQEPSEKLIPDGTKAKSTLSKLKKKGTTIEAKNTWPMVIKTSANLSNWACVKVSVIGKMLPSVKNWCQA